MLIKFKSKHSGNFVMFGHNALPLLRMMGMSGKEEGAVSGEDLSAALARLEAALGQPGQSQSSDTETDEEEKEPTVQLSARALPLLEMLRKAEKNESYVMWQPD